ncbi:hypothetical protein GCM10022296_06140 [Secundilactobacillus similis DSM 23365 = JCM 2765]|nr:MucBP domain-containing protein [Secundilactobacillus similis]
MKKRITGAAKTRFKLYKKGRHWLVMGTTVGLAWGGLVLSGQTARAATESTNQSDVSSQVSGTTAAPKQVTLTTEATNVSNNEATVAPASATAATDTQSVPVVSDTTAEPASETDAEVTETVNASQPTMAADSAMGIGQSDSSWGISIEKTAVSTTTTNQSAVTATPQVTDLGAADSTAFATAKKVATATYQTLGQPQKVTAVAAAQPGAVLTLPKSFSIDTEGLAADEVAKGMYGDTNWVIKDDHTLHIYGEALLGKDNTTVTPQTLAAGDGKTVTLTNASPWFDYRDAFDKIVIDEPIYLPENASYLFAGLDDVTTIDGADKLIASDTTDMTGMFEGDTSLSTLDLSTWDTSKVTAYADMFRLTGLSELDLGPQFSLPVEMPTTILKKDGTQTEASFWIGLGEGTLGEPTGKQFLNTVYSGDAADADTYVAVPNPFTEPINLFFLDAETGRSYLAAKTLRGTIGESGVYTVVTPPDIILADGQAADVPYTFGYGAQNIDVLLMPRLENAHLTDHVSSIVQTETGDVLAQTDTLYQLDAVFAPARLTEITEIKAESFEPNTVTVPDGYEVTKVALIEAFESTGRYGVFTVDKATDDMTVTQYIVNQSTGVVEVTDPVFSKQDYEEIMKRSAVQDGNQYTVNQANINTLSKIKVGSPMPLNTQNMMIYTVRPLPETLTVNYVDQVSNTVVKTADLTGMMAETGDYQVSVPAGYLLAPGQAKQVTYQFAADDTDNVTIKVLPAVSTLVADDQGDSQLTVRYVDGSGKALAPEATQTGQVGQPLTVTAPIIAGYQLAPGQSAETTGTYQGDAMALTLIYEAVPETSAVVLTDGNVAVTASAPATLTTPTATATNQTEVANQSMTSAEPSAPQPIENATANRETDAQPDSASELATTTTEDAQAQGTATATRTQPATQNKLVPTADGHVQVTTPMTLPQTDERSGISALVGILLLGATWLAATVLRKRD